MVTAAAVVSQGPVHGVNPAGALVAAAYPRAVVTGSDAAAHVGSVGVAATLVHR
jgi:hypothetical protein